LETLTAVPCFAMRIVHLTPGTGSFHCGSCLRDNALIKALRLRGHDAIMVPLYLPLVTDDEPASPELDVRVGGINLYVRERAPFLAKLLPARARRFLDDGDRLRAASRKMGMTSAKDLGRMTLGSLRGHDGKQGAEWQELVDWLAESDPQPDLVSLSNSLLAGLVPMIQDTLGCPVAISLQGEDSFLDTLAPPYATDCWELLSQLARRTDILISPSDYYATHMAERLGVERSSVRVVPNGLDWKSYELGYAAPEREPCTIGYLARMIHGKGLSHVVDAFLELHLRGSLPDLKLHIAGAQTDSDKPYLDSIRKQIDQAGASDRVRWSPNVSLEEKIRFLHQVTVFSIPAPSDYGEAFGLPIIEAMACGAPVVQPDNGAYPEIIAATGGGLTFPVDDTSALADQLEAVLTDKAKRASLVTAGQAATRQQFSSTAMAEAFELACS